MIVNERAPVTLTALRRERRHGPPALDWLLWRVVDQRRAVLAVGGILLILGAAAVVRLVGVDRYGFNSDEAVYAGQAAALAGNRTYLQLFGVFRAHPLLVHIVVSLLYRITGVNDLVPRLVCVGAGVALVGVGGALGWVTRGRTAGFLTMLMLAFSAYPIAISRQMLLDGPMALLVAVATLLLALYVRRPRRLTLCAAACAAGLAVLAKETAILLLPAAVVFFCLARSVPLRPRDVILSAAVYVVTMLPFPVSLLVAGGGSSAQHYLVWQIFRPANHTPGFYATLAPTVGVCIVVLAGVGVVRALRRRDAHDILLLTVPAVMIAFYEWWPTKGFEYLLPALAPVAVLAADGALALARLAALGAERLRIPRPALVSRGTLVAITAVILITLLPGALSFTSPSPPTIVATGSEGATTQSAALPAIQFTAGTGGLAASRPVGDWVRSHTLPDTRLLTIGPSLANVIEFYSGRRTLALSVSTDPLHRNPSYQPVRNPDLQIREGAIQYLVYDSYSAARSPHFAKRLMHYVARYHGIAVFTWKQDARTDRGALRRVVAVRIFEVYG